MNTQQAMVNSLRSLLALEDCPNCQDGKKAKGKDAQQNREQVRKLIRQAGKALRDYEQELLTLDQQEYMDSLQADSRAFLAAANEDPERRAEYLDTAALLAKVHGILSAPRGATA
ncbi:hypothetical protein A7D27_12395 [Pseudomonas sp. 1D4]|uniref:hypothetical protein n=1 Tax=Pseudomonadaceae TaxID=135621 RepID=UPI00084A8D82|nr:MULTISPECIES: hypothetical protein [Pseudomonas]OEC42092.1 hypothetical protein A7D27_12395 [Pseudomonas sp. 1D4]